MLPLRAVNPHSTTEVSTNTQNADRGKHVLDVLEGHLSGYSPGNGYGKPKTFTPPRHWLVGNKMTYADLVFVSWDQELSGFPTQAEDDMQVEVLRQYPNVFAWHRRMADRSAFQTSMELKRKLLDDKTLKVYETPRPKVSLQSFHTV